MLVAPTGPSLTPSWGWGQSPQNLTEGRRDRETESGGSPRGVKMLLGDRGRALGAAQAEPRPTLLRPSLLQSRVLPWWASFTRSFLPRCPTWSSWKVPSSSSFRVCEATSLSAPPRPALRCGFSSVKSCVRPLCHTCLVTGERSVHQWTSPWWVSAWRPLGATSALPMAPWTSPKPTLPKPLTKPPRPL